MGIARKNPQNAKLGRALRAASKDLDLPLPTVLQGIKCGDPKISDVVCDYWQWYGGESEACEYVSLEHLQSSPYRHVLGDCMPRRKNTAHTKKWDKKLKWDRKFTRQEFAQQWRSMLKPYGLKVHLQPAEWSEEAYGKGSVELKVFWGHLAWADVDTYAGDDTASILYIPADKVLVGGVGPKILTYKTKGGRGNHHYTLYPQDLADKIGKYMGTGKFHPRKYTRNSRHAPDLHDWSWTDDGKEAVYRIFEGKDHFNNKPLYQVIGVNNDYGGEFHTSKAAAQRELKATMVESRKNPKSRKRKNPRKKNAARKLPTFESAKLAVWRGLGKAGWTLSRPNLKILHATSPWGGRAQVRLWFKPRTILVERGGSPWKVGAARSLAQGLDLRQVTNIPAFVRAIEAACETGIKWEKRVGKR